MHVGQTVLGQPSVSHSTHPWEPTVHSVPQIQHSSFESSPDSPCMVSPCLASVLGVGWQLFRWQVNFTGRHINKQMRLPLSITRKEELELVPFRSFHFPRRPSPSFHSFTLHIILFFIHPPIHACNMSL